MISEIYFQILFLNKIAALIKIDGGAVGVGLAEGIEGYLRFLISSATTLPITSSCSPENEYVSEFQDSGSCLSKMIS